MTASAKKFPASQDAPIRIRTRPAHTVFQARRIKRKMIESYCNGRISQAAVDAIFVMFPELKGA